MKRVAIVAAAVLVLAGCGQGSSNRDPRLGRVVTEHSNCLGGRAATPGTYASALTGLSTSTAPRAHVQGRSGVQPMTHNLAIIAAAVLQIGWNFAPVLVLGVVGLVAEVRR